MIVKSAYPHQIAGSFNLRAFKEVRFKASPQYNPLNTLYAPLNPNQQTPFEFLSRYSRLFAKGNPRFWRKVLDSEVILWHQWGR